MGVDYEIAASHAAGRDAAGVRRKRLQSRLGEAGSWRAAARTISRSETTFRAAAARDFVPLFRSRELTGFVDQALDQNLDIGAAVARIEQADAQARVSSAALWPSLSVNNIAQTNRTPGTVLVPTSGAGGLTPASSDALATSDFQAVSFGFFQLGLTASYEIDFWGKIQDASSAARLLANASRFDRDVVEITTIAAVLNAYFQTLAARDRLRIARDNVRIATEVFETIKLRFGVGTATGMDVAQQQAILADQRASIPPLEQNLQQTENLLAVLLGRAPEDLLLEGGSLAKLAVPAVAPGLPSEVLLRRPDIARAEARLASQEFSVLRARAAFFPSITLTGLYGLQSALLKNLLRPEAVAWQFGSEVAQPLFDGYALQGQYELQKGRYQELATLYRKQILSALTDVENALVAARETERQVMLQVESVTAWRRAYATALARLREGTIDTVTLAITQTSLFQSQDRLAQARLARFRAATSLYQALGGGWSPTTRDIEIAQANSVYEAEKGPWP
ncbi:efflux transporter outer membrane subunit [Methylocystis sp. Sn-Cys]|uniref:efflux transporter outer membrane subunit n=1 Tax=Methylocystis sp. Sn-Cys TaxID=1701263 RepID=UPI00351C08DF